MSPITKSIFLEIWRITSESIRKVGCAEKSHLFSAAPILFHCKGNQLLLPYTERTRSNLSEWCTQMHAGRTMFPLHML